MSLKLTEQQIFDKVATHLLTQGKRSATYCDDTYRCLYRGPDGLKCAAGCLIPDELYDPTFEGKSWTALDRAGLTNLVESIGHRELVRELQRCHDWTEPYDWRERLGQIADEFKLNADVLNKGNPE